MSVVASGMLAFRRGLEGFLPLIKKTANLTSAEIVSGPLPYSIVFVGKWEYPENGEYRKTYTREVVFGRFLTAVTPRMEKKPCHEKSEIIKAILHRRLRDG